MGVVVSVPGTTPASVTAPVTTRAEDQPMTLMPERARVRRLTGKAAPLRREAELEGPMIEMEYCAAAEAPLTEVTAVEGTHRVR